MILGSMPGVYAKKVVAFGYKDGPRTDIYGTEYAENGNQITYQTEDTLFILIMQNGYVSSIEYRMDI